MDARLRAGLHNDHWRTLGAADRRALIDSLCRASEGVLSLVRLDATAVLRHAPTGVLFHLVPGGTVTMGMLPAERDALYSQYRYWDEADSVDSLLDRPQLAPATEVEVAPFLLAARPVGPALLEWLGDRAAGDGAAPPPSDAGRGRKRFDYAAIAKLPAAKYVEYLRDFSTATLGAGALDAVIAQLAKHGLRVPSEAEWEWAARGGTRRLFPSGDTIPSSPNTGENPFGFLDMGADAEVCADGFVPTLSGIPRDGSARARDGGPRVVRGGAAAIYPWQDCGEWTLLLCADRHDGSEFESFLTLRPAITL